VAEKAYCSLPDVDAMIAKGEATPVCYDMQPGDCVAFHFRTVHGAPGNPQAREREREREGEGEREGERERERSHFGP
jgi:hypothetical protein